MDDELERLALAWRGGDREAFRALVLATARELRLHVAAGCDSAELVEEILQRAYVTLFERIAQYRGGGTFLPWLKAIARHHLADHWRERRRLATLDDDAMATAVAADAEDGLERLDERAHATRRLAACLDRLQPRARALIERRHLEGRPLAELARAFKQSMDSLSVALHRIRRSLRACLEKAA